MTKKTSKENILLIVLIIFISLVFGFLSGGGISFYLFQRLYGDILDSDFVDGDKIIERETIIEEKYVPQITEEEIIIEIVEDFSPSVVSVVITKEIPIIEKQWYSPFEGFDFRIPQYQEGEGEIREIGGGTAFIITKEGLAITNKHVVFDKEADYTIITNDGDKYEAGVLARDPVQDLAVLEIKSDKEFKPVKLGNSDNLQIGQKAIAIGNALGEFRNTVSVGVISGLERSITVRDSGMIQTLENLIQTDAAINKGNSGGPLLNMKGEVIGINTAMAQAENIGFALPINKAKRAVEQIKETGEIVYPFLGVRYVLVNEEVKEKNNLPVDYGAWIVGNDTGDPAIVPSSSADKAGLKEWDIILEFNEEKITEKNSLARIISKYYPGDEIDLRILRDGSLKTLNTVLGKRN